jgi:hypothetical protein
MIVAALDSPAVLFFRAIIIQLVVRFLSLRALSDEVNYCHQGIYPTAIFVVVTMRMSAADILSHPGPEIRRQPSAMVFARPPPTAQRSILVTATGSSSDSDSFHESREDTSTTTLAWSNSEKRGQLPLSV